MSGDTEIQINRMMQKFDHEISEMNSTSITEIAGDIRQSDFLKLAQTISVMRGSLFEGYFENGPIRQGRYWCCLV